MGFNKETNEYEGYIYLITNLINNKKYVGQTTTTVEHRKSQHFSKQKNPNTKALYNAIQKHGKENFTMEEIYKVSNSVKENMQKELDEKEIYFIREYNSLHNQYGYNVDKGGSRKSNLEKPVDVYDINGNFLMHCSSSIDAAEKYEVSCSSVQLICKGKQPNYKQQFVFRYTGDSFDKFSTISLKSKFIYQFKTNGDFIKKYDKFSEAEKEIGQRIRNEAIDNPHLLSGGYWWSYSGVFNYQGSSVKKMIDVYDDTEKFIATYDSMSEASRATGVTIDSVISSCEGKSKIHKGYIFCYFGEDVAKNKFVPNHTYNRRAVNQYTRNDEFVKTYNSIVEATRAFTDSKSTAISLCCNHKKNYNTAFGYKWFYANDSEQPNKSKILATNKKEFFNTSLS